MKRVALLLIGLVLSLTSSAQSGGPPPQVITINMMTATSMTNTLPMELFRGKPWRAEPGAKYVKLHMHFERDVFITNVRFTFCANVNEAFTWYVNFDELQGTTDGRGRGNPEVDAATGASARNQRPARPPASSIWDVRIYPPEGEPNDYIPLGLALHSFTVNFENNAAVCVQKVEFFHDTELITAERALWEAETKFEQEVYAHDEKCRLNPEPKDRCGEQIAEPPFDKPDLMGRTAGRFEVRVPRVVEGTVAATSTQPPQAVYDASLMFDSRYEFGWLSDRNKAPKDGDVLTFTFQQPQRVEKLRIWNGYQRSPRHCVTNARVKTLRVEGDGAYAATLPVADVMGFQDLALPTPFEGKTLKLRVQDVVLGLGPKDWDTGISELRFFDGKDWFLIDPTAKLKAIADANRAAFRAAGLDAVLDKELGIAATDNAPAGQLESFDLRLRADGSMYFAAAARNQTKLNDRGAYGGTFQTRYSALGNYEVKGTVANGLQLRLFGTQRESEKQIPDCNGCGWDCNNPLLQAGSKESRIFQENVQLVREGDKFTLISATTRFIPVARASLLVR